MGMSKDILEKNIKKMLSIIKPEGVTMIDFELNPIKQNEYYLSLIYVVPDDSPYMKVNRKEDPRHDWNRTILYSIRDYFNTRVIINSTNLTTESFYKQQKEKIKQWQKN